MKWALGLTGASAAILAGGLVNSAAVQEQKTAIEENYAFVVEPHPMLGKFRGLGALAPDIDQLRPQGLPLLGTRLNVSFGQPEKSPLETFYEKTAVNYVPNSSDFRPNTDGQVLHDVYEYDRSSKGYQLRRDDIVKAAQTARGDLARIDDNEQWSTIVNATSGLALAVSAIGLAATAYRRRGAGGPVPPWAGPAMRPALPAGPAGPGMQNAGGAHQGGFQKQGPDDANGGGWPEGGPAHSGMTNPDDGAALTQDDLAAARRQGGIDAMAAMRKEFPNGVVFPGNGAAPISLAEHERRRERRAPGQ